MTNALIVVAGLGLLLVVAAGVVILWIVDARRAERVAADPERVEEQPQNQTHRWQSHRSSHH